MASCMKCCSAFENPKDVLVCCECKGSFHPTCTSLQALENLKRNKRSVWVCDVCKSESSSTASQEPGASMVEFMKRMEANLSNQISKVTESIGGVKEQLERVQQTVATMDSTLKSLVAENDARKQEYESIKNENIELKKSIDEINGRVRDLEQYSRRDNLEIVGVPHSKDESIYRILERLAGILGLPFSRGEVSVAHRLPASKVRPYPNIIVKFVSRERKTSWLQAARQFKKNLTAAELSDQWPSTAIFINEHLSAHNKAVLGRARRLVKEGKLALAWSRDGKVFARRTWDTNCRPTILKTEEDVERLLTVQ